MTKLRVYELARELNVETKLLLSKLKGAARSLSHQSTLTDQQVAELRSAFGAPTPAQGTVSSDAGKPRVVIRRRVVAGSVEGEGVPTTGAALSGESHDGDAAGGVSSAEGPAGPSDIGSMDAGTPALDHRPMVSDTKGGESVTEAPIPVSMSGAVNLSESQVSPKVVEPLEPAVSPGVEASSSIESTPPSVDKSSPYSATIVRPAGVSRPSIQSRQGAVQSGAYAPQNIRKSTRPPEAQGGLRSDGGAGSLDRIRSKEFRDGRDLRDGAETREFQPSEHSEDHVRKEESPRSSVSGGRSQPLPSPAAAAASSPAASVPAAGGGASAPRRREMGGATIVRRATPEEIENLQNQAAKRQQAGRKEDARGTRVTGIGLLQNRISAEGPAVPIQNLPSLPAMEEEGWGPRRGVGVVKDKKTFDEEEQARKKAAKNRRSNTMVNMRALLEEVDDTGAPDEEAAREQAGRTVYTPSAARSKRDIKRRKDLKKTQITTPRAAYRVVEMEDGITLGELARQLSVKAPDLIKKLMGQGVMATINQTLDVDTATLLASEYGFEVKSVIKTVDDILKVVPVEETDLEPRAPIVTVMGHVDHGKTSILDAIRSAKVASGEAGGITQHIGAYSVEKNGKLITFLDTPGHEAFSAMRARGAKVTDIVVLVVAADDGVMPQTKEAISHAKAANVPLIVAINKIDKPNTNLDRVYTELTEQGVQAEEWGGETQFIKCSALQRKGIDELLDAVLLQAEILDLKATRKGLAEGVVIEAHLDRGRGPVATMVVQRGTLRVGDYVVAGSEYGRIRAMLDHKGHELGLALPSQPVEIIGLSGVPMAGDKFNIVSDEKTAREASGWRLDQARKAAAGKSSAASLEDLLARVKSEDVPEVPIIVKADTQGSLEAISETLLKLSTPKVRNRIIHSAVGGVTESDITLAQASKSFVVGFNVRASRSLEDFAERSGVPVRYFSIIYEIVDAVKSIMVGKLPPIVNEVVLGHAEVRRLISVPKFGTIAGSAVMDGKIIRNAQCRLIRDNVVIYTGKLSSLRRFKDDVKEVLQGFECGIGIEGYNDLREGDVIEAFTFEEQVATL